MLCSAQRASTNLVYSASVHDSTKTARRAWRLKREVIFGGEGWLVGWLVGKNKKK